MGIYELYAPYLPAPKPRQQPQWLTPLSYKSKILKTYLIEELPLANQSRYNTKEWPQSLICEQFHQSKHVVMTKPKYKCYLNITAVLYIAPRCQRRQQKNILLIVAFRLLTVRQSSQDLHLPLQYPLTTTHTFYHHQLPHGDFIHSSCPSATSDALFHIH